MSSTILHTAPLPSPARLGAQAPASLGSVAASLSRLWQRLIVEPRRVAAAQQEKEALLRRARRYASTNPSFAADLYAAAGRDEVAQDLTS